MKKKERNSFMKVKLIINKHNLIKQITVYLLLLSTTTKMKKEKNKIISQGT
jgi:hypothetical protein